mmetsp:Transcript_10608/g.14709  ORF Transcript_10608/g.14709 Transcript_10608/m.14709 type:complete len:190 (-) Transcript_10608:412-981(-)
MTSSKEQNEPEIPPAFVVIVSGAEGESSAANGSYAVRAMWEGRPAYFHTENSEASIRWYGEKSAWVIMMKDGPRFASGGLAAGDPSMCKEGSWMQLSSDKKWEKNKELEVRIASKEELEDVEFAETLATQNDKQDQNKLKTADGDMANAYADMMKQAAQGKSKHIVTVKSYSSHEPPYFFNDDKTNKRD